MIEMLEDLMTEKDMTIVAKRKYRTDSEIFNIIQKWENNNLLINHTTYPFEGYEIIISNDGYDSGRHNQMPETNSFSYNFKTVEIAKHYRDNLIKHFQELTLRDKMRKTEKYKIRKITAEYFE